MIKKTLVFLLSLTVISVIGCNDPTSPPDTTQTGTYSITYFQNGAIDGSVPVDPNQYAEGETVTAAANTGSLVRTNYVLTGWNTESNGTGSFYSIGSSFLMPSSDLFLYAVWQFAPNELSFTDKNAGLIGVRYNPACSTDDVDGDGDIDIFICGQSTSGDKALLYLNDGSGNFSDAEAGLTALRYTKSAFADIDDDGDPDLCYLGMTGGGNSTTKLYLNDGNGVFSEEVTTIANLSNADIAFADVDNDGDPDLFILGDDRVSATEPYKSLLYINEGDSDLDGNWDGFTLSAASFEGVIRGSCSFADIDKNNYLDLMITGEKNDSDPVTIVYSNNGDGSFSDSGISLPQLGSHGSGNFADIDNDGDADIILAGYDTDYLTHTYVNDGSGAFSLKQNLTGISGGIIIADPDADGDFDLLIHGSNQDSKITVFFTNDGNGNFTEEDFGFTDADGGDGQFFDADGDTDLDLIICGADTNTTGKTSLYTNNRLE